LQILQIDQDLSSEVAKNCGKSTAKSVNFERKITITAEDQLKRVDIRSPQDGTVFQSTVHTVGGAIKAGKTMVRAWNSGESW